MQATAADEEATLSVGVPVRRVHAGTWALAGALATLGGLFLAGFPGAPQPTLGDAALRAFPAIVLGGLGSPVGAVVGGVLIGVVEVLTSGYAPDSLGTNFYAVAPYIAMIAILLVRPYGLFGARPGGARVMRGRALLVAVVLVALVLPFQLGTSALTTATFVVIAAIGATGLNILTGYAGQISLGHAFFLAVGAYTGAKLGEDLGWSAALWIPAAGVVAGAVRRARRPGGAAAARPLPGDRDARAWSSSASTSSSTPSRSPAGRRAARSRRS